MAGQGRVRREEIAYDGRIWHRYPDAEGRSESIYYTAFIDGRSVYLHRYIYEENHGAIPDGYVVHHKDGISENNDPANLEVVSPWDHMSWHGRNRSEEYLEASRIWMHKIRSLAAAWHRSEEGRAWHSIHGKRSWENREPITLICQHCRIEFETIASHGNTKFCSNKCKSAARRASGIDNAPRQCAHCGQQFMADKYKKTRHCSRLCAVLNR